MIVIEMNPRVSRSSALASKATGFPIAKIAAKLAVGYTLDEIPNDITRKTPAAFEPALDYVVVKVPRFAFEKFPGADPVLTTHMKSVGRGDGHRPQLHRGAGQGAALDGDQGRRLLDHAGRRTLDRSTSCCGRAAVPTDGRLYARRAGAARRRAASRRSRAATGIDPWFVDQIALAGRAAAPNSSRRAGADPGAAAQGQAARAVATASSPRCARSWPARTACALLRLRSGIRPVFKTVDTCAAEFAATTPYHYSCYDEETEVAPQPERPKVIILGSGPNRIGQGIEFDYSCVHAVDGAARGRATRRS